MAFPASSNLSQRWLMPVLAVVAFLALALPALVVAYPPPIPMAHPTPRHAVRVVPPAELPPVEPVAFQDLPPADARTWNAAVPFADGANPAARPFHLGGAADDRARAIDCMAAAMLYEAGDDPVGERAVGQVVINRVRHPAFPKSVCAVVFQGSERRTGCQFTFTCDGAMERAPNPAGWERARKLALAALTGTVFAKVGHATHYHTDWVVPYWSASLDKVAQVHTHLFFRWTGWWGTPPAFRRTVDVVEPIVAQLAAWSPAHNPTAALEAATGVLTAAVVASALPPDEAAISGGTFLLKFDKKLDADAFPGVAATTCGTRDYCKLLAWTDKKQVPKALPATTEQAAAMAFSYLRDRSKGFDKALWNCDKFKRADARQCMKVQFAAPQKPLSNFRIESAPGIRTRLTLPAPAPSATPPRTSPAAKP